MMGTHWLGAHFIYLNHTESTNLYLKKLSEEEFSPGTVVLADHQTKGRGQYGRIWEAEENKNLTFTAGFKPESSDRLILLTLSSALSIKYALQKYTDCKILIRWPNDILVNQKKIAGILTECVFNGSNIERVLVGVGLNVLQTEFSKTLKGHATSLKLLTHSVPSREQLLSDILQQMEFLYTRWHKHDPHLHLELNRQLIGYGKWVKLKINNKISDKEYKFCGINENGYLVVLNNDLDVKIFRHEQVKIMPDRG